MKNGMNRTPDQVIRQRRKCVDSEESDKEILTEYIREFVESKRGNQKRLAEASGVAESAISNLLKNTRKPPGMENILLLAEKIQKLIQD
ncbi:helix-turn-helix domain-containing protein [Leptospira santarosai]|uniref:helix-turn-helix domain-containing protein n=1 Tax=Leptospira santarosai TaxID=28183 RepID=UPI000308774E|nr:helix-turn-helix transcriptional regulator [Leptospira santarosai]